MEYKLQRGNLFLYNYLVITLGFMSLLIDILYTTTYFEKDDELKEESRMMLRNVCLTFTRFKIVFMPMIIILFKDIKDKFRSFSILDEYFEKITIF